MTTATIAKRFIVFRSCFKTYLRIGVRLEIDEQLLIITNYNRYWRHSLDYDIITSETGCRTTMWHRLFWVF